MGEVRTSVTSVGKAKAHTYPGKATVIRVVGPNFMQAQPATELEAVKLLAPSYASVFEEFAYSSATTLRLLPISSGIFAGSFGPVMPQITAAALDAGFKSLPMATRSMLRGRFATHKAEMCIFGNSDYDGFHAAWQEGICL